MNKLFVEAASFIEESDIDLARFFNAGETRRLGKLCKNALFCAAQTLYRADIDRKKSKDDIALIIASSAGPISESLDFMNGIIFDGDELASPLAFSASVHNAVEAALTRLLNLRGHTLTVSEGPRSFLSALTLSKTLLSSGQCKKVLLGVCEEAHPVAKKAYPDKKFHDQTAFFLLSLDERFMQFSYQDETDADNPADYAVYLSKKYQNVLDKSDIKKIIGDCARVYLASRKIKVFENYFAPDDIKETFASINKEYASEIFETLKTMFSISPDEKIDADNIVDACFYACLKSQTFTFITSGSTGEPTKHTHTFEMIKEEVGGAVCLFRHIKRIVCIVPACHSYGFIFGGQLSKALNIPIIYKSPIPYLEWNTILKDGDLLVGFPLFYKYMQAIDFHFPKGVALLTSTAPCPEDLLLAISKATDSIVEIYGSSETGAIAFRRGAGQNFKLLDFWEFSKTSKDDVCIIRKVSRACVALPDKINMSSDLSFSILGRKDKAVQTAGVNVYPHKIEAILKLNDFIKDAAVRLDNDRLKAFIVLKEGISEEAARREIYDYMDKKLTALERPHKITFGKALPVNAFGKKIDW